ncbi:MAG: response regulator [Chitinophagaceae bacterium]
MDKIANSKHCILVVDDDEDVLFLMKKTLQLEGYDTTVSPNGENIMDIIAQSTPDMILLDIHMNGIDGGTICKLIKTNKTTANIPILMFSANENIAGITRQCGADGYIRKPFEPTQLKQKIKQILYHS